MKFYGKDGNQKHLFKIIKSGMKTNFYNDVPFNNATNPAHAHNSLEDVVSVIHCGINETEVFNVPVKDIEILPTYSEMKLQKYENTIKEAIKILGDEKNKKIS